MNDRSSIKRHDIGDGRTMTSFRVFPPVDDRLRDMDIASVLLARDVVTDFDALAKFRAAVAVASVEELELARPAILFQLSELKEFITSTAVRVSMDGTVKETPEKTLEAILTGVVKEIGGMISELDRSPRNRSLPRTINGAMAYLAEVVSFTARIAEKHDASFLSLSEDASMAFIKLADRIRRLKEQTVERYPEIAKNLYDPADILNAADARVAIADLNVPKLTDGQFDEVSWAVGDWDILWKIAQKEEWRAEYIEKGWYRPFGDEDAEHFRGKLLGLLDDVNEPFNGGGLINELRMIPAVLYHMGKRAIDYADGYDERDIRRSFERSKFRDKEQHMQEEMESLPQNRFSDRTRGMNNLASSDMLSSFLVEIEKSFHPDKVFPNRMRFTRHESGPLVGTLDRQWDYAIVIYRDKGVGPRDAVYAVRIPLADMESGIPDLEAIRWHPEYKATNYYSIDDALVDMGGEIEANFFFDGLRVEANDGFKLLAAERREIGRQIKRGKSLSDFPDYDHSHVHSQQGISR